MVTTRKFLKTGAGFGAAVLLLCVFSVPAALAQPCNPVAGGTLDPCSVPKYVTPLVIPPVMNNDGTADSYDIAVRQFDQQILPGGIWNTINGRSDALPATTVWSYGPDADPTPTVAPDPNSQFNYPAYTIETISNTPVDVRWINDLVDKNGKFLKHLLPVDQTVHWANPLQECMDGSERTDCAGTNPKVYRGPVPIVTHVHGAHVNSHSDGYPEAWWLPAARNIPKGYATSGSLFDDSTGSNLGNLGYADYSYRQDQPATTLWYHDHSLGMTRLNVYAGPAGFWLIRGGVFDKGKDGATGKKAVLPGPAPVAGDTVLELNAPDLVPGTDDVRSSIREIPIVIQDRSFNDDGSLFYPDNRAFFEGLRPNELFIDFAPDSDVLPIWNPEAFFNVMVVNGVSWPSLDVADARYRFRLLNGCNSRFLNLALFVLNSDGSLGQEIPFYQIGAEQGFLPQVAEIQTGFATLLPGNGKMPVPVAASDPAQALLMGLAERADVIVDFGGLPDGTVVRMINTAPDAPFGGFPDDPDDPDYPADPGTSGQVMQFVVDTGLHLPADDLTTSPFDLKMKAEKPLRKAKVTRQVSLNEAESEVVCVFLDVDADAFVEPIVQVPCDTDSVPEGYEVVPFGPTEALLGPVDLSDPDNPVGIPLKWTDNSGVSTPVPVTMADGVTVKMINVTENPTLGDIEVWEIYNFTADAHPIHLHLVRFEVIGRGVDGTQTPEAWETGFKDSR